MRLITIYRGVNCERSTVIHRTIEGVLLDVLFFFFSNA